MLEYNRKGLCCSRWGKPVSPSPTCSVCVSSTARQLSHVARDSRHLYRIQAAAGRQHTAAFFTGYKQRQVDSIQPPSLQDTGGGR
jgi:hypothetical protein